MRKVRASGERITDNVRRWRHPGKCNRNRQPNGGRELLCVVMMERCGKSAPIRMATCVCCKPYPKQYLCGSPPYAAAMPQPQWQRTRGEIRRGVSWQHGIEIDDCPRQNPAYRRSHLICIKNSRFQTGVFFLTEKAKYISRKKHGGTEQHQGKDASGSSISLFSMNYSASSALRSSMILLAISAGASS